MKSQPDISMEFSAYLDGQLPPDAARWVDRAATESPDVARRLHDLRRIRTILRSLEPVRPGPDFVARVIAEANRRGLMRRVVGERTIQGVIHLASAAAAVLLMAVVTGVAVQSFMHEPRSTGPLSGPAPAGPVLAVAPAPQGSPAAAGRGRAIEGGSLLAKGGDGRAMPTVAKPAGIEASELSVRGVQTGQKLHYDKHGGKAGSAPRKSLGGALGESVGEARKLNLSVADLGAGAKEVEAVLASAGIVKTTGGAGMIAKLAESNTYGLGTVADQAAKPAAGTVADQAAKPAGAVSAKRQTGRAEMFYRAPGDTNELRFIVVAQPDRIAAVTTRLGDLRQNEQLHQSLQGLCAAKVARPGAGLPKAVPDPTTTAPDAKPSRKPRPANEPYHTAEIQRLGNNSPLATQQTINGLAPTSQVAQPTKPGLEVLIITVRLHRPEANRADPMRNTKQ